MPVTLATPDRPWLANLPPVAPEHLAGDLVRPDDPVYGLIWVNRGRVSGAPCFYGTRVPVQNLFDYLETGYTLDQFLADFDGVTREQAVGVIDVARAGLLAELPKP